MLRLADLLAEKPFGLELISGGPDAAEREVRGAHAVEVDAPARWLGRDWIMLTTGVRLRRNADAQRALVPQLEAGGAAALGFGVGLSFKRVPPALVAVARERGFPVFEVPYETPFREIVRFVDSALTSGEEQVFRRLTALQRYLVDALRTPQPERAMVDRLAGFLDASVLLLDADGTPRIVAGKPPVAAIVDAHHSRRDAELAVRRGDGVTWFEDFDLATFMISEIAPERLGPKVDEILAVLHANPPLHEALSAYFEHHLDIAATAASLHMHRNSPRYRLARAEVAGRSLKQPATIAAIHIALVAEAGVQTAAGSLDAARLPAGAARP